MANIIFIRHSETRQEPDKTSHAWVLTEEGKQKCRRLAELLRPWKITRMVSSQEAKAELTAELTAQELGIPYETAPNLRETKRNTLPYLPLDEFRALIRQGMEQPDALIVGEERFTDALQRFTEQINMLQTQYPDETLAIVTHGTVLALYLADQTDTEAYALWQSLEMPAFAVLDRQRRSLLEFVPSIPWGS